MDFNKEILKSFYSIKNVIKVHFFVNNERCFVNLTLNEWTDGLALEIAKIENNIKRNILRDVLVDYHLEDEVDYYLLKELKETFTEVEK